MLRTKPHVFLIGESKVVKNGLDEYLHYINAGDWDTNAPSEPEKLIETYGRICYRSFKPGLNPNVTRVREGNKEYLTNIANQKHGSVFEHVTVNFVFCDVSRVFTHELVRHRAGVAISQESLRYVRLDSLKMWFPTVIEENQDAMNIYVDTVEKLEEIQRQLAYLYELDNPDKKFEVKKQITSAMRRIAPIGLATTIGWSSNLRTLRWVIEVRTSPSAEEEIRYVFGRVGEIVKQRYPNAFEDFEIEMVDGLPWYKPMNSKI